MKRSATPLLFTITHPDCPGVEHKILAIMDDLTPEQEIAFCRDVLRSNHYQDAKWLVIETGKYVKPKPPKDSTKDPDAKQDATGEDKKEAGQQQKGADQATTQEEGQPRVEKGEQTGLEAGEESKAEAGEQPQTQKAPPMMPLYPAVTSHRSVTKTMVELAQKQHKPVYVLDTPTYMNWQKFLVVLHKCTKPHTIAKALGLSSFFGAPAAGVIAWKDKLMHDDLNVARQGFQEEDMRRPMQWYQEDEVNRKDLGTVRTRKWIDRGYDGHAKTPLTGVGLFDTMKDPMFGQQDANESGKKPGMFIMVTAGHVLDLEYGLLKYLKEDDFEVTEIKGIDWRRSWQLRQKAQSQSQTQPQPVPEPQAELAGQGMAP